MEKQINSETTFTITELEQRLEMAQCPPGHIDMLEWIDPALKGFFCVPIPKCSGGPGL
jgi:hypothetical protein